MYRVLTPADRARAWAVTAVTTGLMGWLIVTGLQMGPTSVRDAALEVFDVAPPVPPPPEPTVTPERKRSPRPEGEAAPPNLRAVPKEVVAPEPIVPPVTPPLPAPPIAATGPDTSSGASDRAGPGTGAGGIGNGRGSGGEGDGDGGGGMERMPERIQSRVSMRDYPEALIDAGINTSVGVRYAVQPDGRVTGCRVIRSSGYREVDALTCREIERGYRYRPWRDADGRAVASVVVHDFDWFVDDMGR
jgi:protein TonB